MLKDPAALGLFIAWAVIVVFIAARYIRGAADERHKPNAGVEQDRYGGDCGHLED